MTHPTSEEWMTLLYGDGPEQSLQSLRAHLASCAECRHRYASWEKAAGDMNTWKLTPPVRRTSVATPLLRWAAAAAVAGLAIAGGMRLWTMERTVNELRAELRQKGSPAGIEQLRAETRKMVEAATAEFEQKRSSDQQAVVALLDQLQRKSAATYAGLRKELETVAVMTEAGLRHTENEIANIAYTPREEIRNQ